MLSPPDFSFNVYCVRPDHHVLSSPCEMSLAIAVHGRLCLVVALKQYGLCERKREAAHLRSEDKVCFLPPSCVSTERETIVLQFFCTGTSFSPLSRQGCSFLC